MSPTAKITSRQGPVVSATDGKVNGMLRKFDGALMINLDSVPFIPLQ